MHECKFCDRTFIGKRALINHQSEHEKEVPRVIPNNDELWAIVKQLAKNNSRIIKNIKILTRKNKMYQHNIEELTKQISKNENNIIKLRKKRPKVEIIDWLNSEHIKDVKSFREWKRSLVVTDDQMEFLLEKKYVNGIINILTTSL